MLVTHTPIGELRARPMAIAAVDDDCRVWFFSASSSGKMHEIEDHSQVNVVCQKDQDVFISISGRARMNRDRAKIDELWNEFYRVWFPRGKNDADLVLLSIEPQEGEYWDNEGFNKVKMFFEAAKAYATRSQPHVTEGDQHAKVVLDTHAPGV